MKKLGHWALILTLFLSALQTAQAALLIEPLAGFNVGKLTAQDLVGTDSDDYDLKGFSYGGRLGYQNFGFQLGLDYLNSNLDVESSSDNLKTSEWAGFVGFKFPVLLKVYAGYIFSGTGDNGDVDYKGGTGPKFGVGTTILPFLDINLEYRKISYDERKVSGVTSDTDDKYSSVLLSISLPFTL